MLTLLLRRFILEASPRPFLQAAIRGEFKIAEQLLISRLTARLVNPASGRTYTRVPVTPFRPTLAGAGLSSW